MPAAVILWHAPPGVSHVSDTALWVATYRATESARPDGLFLDPLASRAGDLAAAPRKLWR